MKKGKRMLWLAVLAAALVVGYILATQWGLLPRARVVATGTIETADGKVLRTRQYIRASRKVPHKTPGAGTLREQAVWEVELPNGRWIECDGDDCLGTYEKTRR